MKRLKTALVVLFALTLSLFLFACGGGEETKYKVSVQYDNTQGSVTLDPQKDEYAQDEKIVITVTANSGYLLKSFKVNDADVALSNGKYNLTVKGDTTIKAEFEQDLSGYEYVIDRIASVSGVRDLTDSAEQAELDAMLAGITLNVVTDGDNVTLKVADCDVEGLDAVKLHTIGDYKLTLTPKECNPDGRSTEVSFSIDHDWEQSTDDPNIKVCRHDKAQLETLAEDAVIHYGTFHEGIDATLPANVWEESKVFTNNAEKSNLSEFGTVKTASGDVRVPTITAGHLEKGMTITLRGTAKTTAGEDGPWGHANENWNSPSIGIADRDLNLENPAHPGYTGGTSVIVREEGWVLYDGIGNNRMLASIMGGAFTTSNGWRNYGSHPNESTTTSPQTNVSGYVHGKIPTDWSSVGNWWVYSEGATMPSSTSYATDTPIEYSWTYREDGVIEMVYRYNYTDARPSELKIYVKVPDSAAGYYDTILHGDYCDINITESEIITLRTPLEGGFTYKGITSGAKTAYAENDVFDAATINATMKYVQAPTVDETLRISNAQVYAYTGSEDYNTVKGNSDILNSLDNWVSMANSNLSAKFKVFKIHFTRGGKTFIALMNNADGSLPFTITENKVESAEGGDVTISDVLFANNSKVGALALSLNADKKIVLTPEGTVYAQALSAEQKALFSNLGSASKYIALHIYGTALDTVAAFDSEFTVKAGSATVPHLVSIEDGNVHLVLAVSQASDSVVISGLQSTDIVLDLSNLAGLKASSDVKTQGMSLNAANGELTITYTLPANTAQTAIVISLPGYNLSFTAQEWLEGKTEFTPADAAGEDFGQGFKMKHMTYEGTTLTLTLVVPAASLTAYQPIEVTLTLDGQLEITDYVQYDFSFVKADGSAVLDDGYLALAGSNNSLLVAKAFATKDLKNGAISGTVSLNINNGVFDTFSTHGILTIEYAVENGDVTILNEVKGVTGAVTFVGTFGDSRDTDYGAIVVLTIDVTTLGIESGDYYFEQIKAFDGDNAPASIYKISSGKLSVYTITASNASITVFTEGNCQSAGLYAWEVKEGGKVVCYAGVGASGGAHDFGDGDTCVLCGAAKAEAVLNHDENTCKNTLQNGQYVEISGKYNDATHKGLYHGIETNLRNNGGTSFYVRVRNDGYIAREIGDETLVTLDYNSTMEFTGSAGGTCLGYLNGVDGEAIDDASYLAAKKGGSFKVYASYVDGVVTVVTSLWTAEQDVSSKPYFTYTARMTVVAKPASVNINFRIDSYELTPEVNADGICTLVRGNVSESLIDAVETSAVDSHALPSELEISNSGNAITLNGTAAAEGNGFYAAFKVTFKKALVASTKATVLDAEGNVWENAVAKLNANRDELLVYLPFVKGVSYTTAKVDFLNFEGNSEQGDLIIDVTRLVFSNIKGALDKKEIKLAGDTLTLTYTGKLEDAMQLSIGGAQVAISALAGASSSAAVDIGDHFACTGINKTDAQTVINLTYKGADLSALADIEVNLLDASGSVLARNSVTPNVVDGLGTQLEESGWHLVVKDAVMTLVSSEQEADSLPVIVNAGKAATDTDALGVYELGFKNGKFNATNIITEHATVTTVSLGGKTVTVITVDLKQVSALGITADKPFGVMLMTEGASKYYLVAPTGAATETSAAEGTQKTFSATQSCTAASKASKTNADESFYWDFTIGRSHSFVADPVTGLPVCSVCGAISVNGDLKNIKLPALKGITTSGMTIAFEVVSGFDDDWNAVVLSTTVGNVRLLAANLQGNVQTTLPYEFKNTPVNENRWPLDQHLKNGNAWNYYQQAGLRVTVSIAADGTFKFYKGDELAIQYNPTDAGNGSFTIKDFADLFLGLGEHGGFTVANGGMTIKNIMIDKKVLSDEEVAARNALYAAEKLGLTADNYNFTCSEHKYGTAGEGTDTYCEYCGALNPNHTHKYEEGKCVWCEAPQEHEHSYDDTDHCNVCGQLNPEHVHSYDPDSHLCRCGEKDPAVGHEHTFVNGVCSDCHYVCTHTFTSEEGECSVCHQATGKQLHSENPANTDGFADHSVMYTMAKPADGKVLAVVYSVKFDTDSALQDYTGVVTRIFDAEVEQAFLQGNCFLLFADTEPWGTKANADRTLAAYGTVSKAGYSCRVTVLWDGDTITVTYEVWTAEDDVKQGPDKTGKVTFSGVEKDTYNVFFGQDGVTGSGMTLVANEYDRPETTPTVQHSHSYVNGLCTVCKAVQPASEVSEGSPLEITWEAGTFSSNKWTQDGFTKGSKVAIYGTQTKASATEAWFSLIAEVDTLTPATSVTLRTDGYGWYFDNSGTSHVFEDTRKQNSITKPDATAVALNWDIVKQIITKCDYRVEFDWTGENIVVTMSLTCTADGEYKGQTFTQIYTVDAGELTSVNVRFGAEQAAGTADRVVSTPAAV